MRKAAKAPVQKAGVGVAVVNVDPNIKAASGKNAEENCHEMRVPAVLVPSGIKTSHEDIK